MLQYEKKLILGVLFSIILGNIILMLFISALLENQASNQLHLLRADKESEIINELRGRVESANSIAHHFSATYSNKAEAQQKSMAAISALRFGQDNYIWVHRLDPKKENSAFMLVHPAKNLVARDLSGLIDLEIISTIYHNGRVYNKAAPEVSHIYPTDIFKEFNKKCLLNGKGIVPYYWPKIIDGETTKTGFYKLSYVHYFPDWQWVIGAGAYADHIDQLVAIEAAKIQGYSNTIFNQSVIVITCVSFFILLFVLIQLKISFSAQKKAEKALVEARDAAEQSNNTKSEFLANMSHEIRTPMNSIIGMTGLILDTTLKSQQRKYLVMIQKSADQLLQVVNDILDFSKIEKGDLVLVNEMFNLHETIDELTTSLMLPAQEKSITLSHTISPDVPQHIMGDVNRLLQILLNLLGNAIKFTKGGSVELKITTQKQSDPDKVSLFFQIKDTGIGIPQAKQVTIFESFSQADTSHSRKFGGTGLGLAISVQLIKMMGGRIGLKSKTGAGSTFWFTAGFGKKDSTVKQAAHTKKSLREDKITATYDFNGTKALVADDELFNRVLAQTLLEEKGMQVMAVNNGFEALQAVAGDPYDLILMDIQMPELDGLEAAKQIRLLEKQQGGQTPIIALTAHALEEDRQKCLNAGMDDYISKPIDVEKLFVIISKHIS